MSGPSCPMHRVRHRLLELRGSCREQQVVTSAPSSLSPFVKPFNKRPDPRRYRPSVPPFVPSFTIPKNQRAAVTYIPNPYASKLRHSKKTHIRNQGHGHDRPFSVQRRPVHKVTQHDRASILLHFCLSPCFSQSPMQRFDDPGNQLEVLTSPHRQDDASRPTCAATILNVGRASETGWMVGCPPLPRSPQGPPTFANGMCIQPS